MATKRQSPKKATRSQPDELPEAANQMPTPTNRADTKNVKSLIFLAP
jgi:hypothetical protein